MKLKGICTYNKETRTLSDNYTKEEYDRVYEELSREYKYIIEIDDEGVVKVIKDTRKKNV